MKRCRICGKEKPLTDFYKHSHFEDGYNTKCKVCAKSYETKMRKYKERKKAEENSTQFFRWDPKNMTI